MAVWKGREREYHKEYLRKWRGYKGQQKRLDHRAPLEERFWSKVQKSESCWLWIGSLRNGYGAIGLMVEGKRRTKYAHRVAYELLIGQIPEGMTIDHLCRNPRCVNPKHLEPVNIWENTKRAISGDVSEHMKSMSVRAHAVRWGSK